MKLFSLLSIDFRLMIPLVGFSAVGKLAIITCFGIESWAHTSVALIAKAKISRVLMVMDLKTVDIVAIL
jgi:hypothetical protein